jgi:hypothetical protein
MTQYLGGVQLADNIQILSYKNDTTHWLSLYKDEKFIEFVTHGPEIYTLNASPCGKFLAYYQSNPDTNTIDFDIWKYDAEDQSFDIFTSIKTSLDTALSGHMTQICFNTQSTHVIGLSEWNHVYVVPLTKLEPPTEFYIANGCDEIMQQVIHTGPENYFAWFGQDEYVRIIDLNGKHPVMWSDKLLFSKANSGYNKNSKYFFVFCGYLVYMSNSGTIILAKPNLQDKLIQPDYNIKYPVTKYTDISIIDGKTLCFHRGEDCFVTLA